MITIIINFASDRDLLFFGSDNVPSNLVTGEILQCFQVRDCEVEYLDKLLELVNSNGNMRGVMLVDGRTAERHRIMLRG